METITVVKVDNEEITIGKKQRDREKRKEKCGIEVVVRRGYRQ